MTYRDDVRAKHASRDAEIRRQGVNVDDVRRESRGSGAVAAMTTRLMNEPTPTAGHERLGHDNFAGQVFNGTNNEYTLSRQVLGNNIGVEHMVQASGSNTTLTKTTNPAPSAGEFWFDGNFTIRVGTPPAALDGLIAYYIAPL